MGNIVIARWRYGDLREREFPVRADVAVLPGILVRCHGELIPASALICSAGGVQQAQADFAEWFAGVSMEGSEIGETALISAATSGVFEFPCLPAVFNKDDLVGIAIAGWYGEVNPISGNGRRFLLSDTFVEKVFSLECAIGRCDEGAVGPTSVLVRLLPRRTDWG